MATFKINNKEFEISENSQMTSTDFLQLESHVGDCDVETILEIAYLLRFNYQQSRSLFDIAFLKERNLLKRENIQISIIGLMLQHKQDIRSFLEDSYVGGNKQMEYLKGLFFMNNGQYEDAEFLFEAAGFKKGMEVCKVMRNDVEEMSKSSNPVVQCYLSSKNWKNFKNFDVNEIFKFIVHGPEGMKELDQNSFENFDVKVTLLVNELEKLEQQIRIRKEGQIEMGSAVENQSVQGLRGVQAQLNCGSDTKLDEMNLKLNLLRDKFIELSDKPSAYLLYLIGKIYHLQNNFKMAEEWYNRALSIENCYPPAMFNLCRIQGIQYVSDMKNSEIQDHNALISLEKLNFNLDLNSDLVRRLCRVTIQARKMDKTIITDLESLRGYFNEIEVTNNLSILKEGSESIENLENLIQRVSPMYKEYICYNLGVMKGDERILKECLLPEAQLQLDFLRKDKSTLSHDLKAYLNREDGLMSSVNDPVSNKPDSSSPFENILNGFICIDTFLINRDDFNYLNKAEALFMKESNSIYSVNGLGICAALRGNISSAITLFQQIGDQFDGALKNLGNCYVILKQFGKAIDFYIKYGKLNNKDKETLEFLAEQTKDLKALETIEKLLDSSIVRNRMAMILLEKGEVEKAKEIRISDPEILKKIGESANKDEERKRKMAEIEEYRKKQRNK